MVHSDAVSGEGKQINITIGAHSLGKKDGSEAWLIYDMSRASWRGDHFTQAFPNEKAYRHSLREEAESLNAAASVLKENYKKPNKRKNLQPSLLTLLELHEKGMIEPFVLLSKPDAGIARDYVAYRAEHRDKLREYISEWLIKPDSTAPVGPHACLCPSSIGAEAGAPPLATLPPQGNQPGLVACGYREEKKTGDPVLASEFGVFQCGAEHPFLEFDALQRAEIVVGKDKLEITEIASLPFGRNWQEVDVPFKLFMVTPGEKPIVCESTTRMPKEQAKCLRCNEPAKEVVRN